MSEVPHFDCVEAYGQWVYDCPFCAEKHTHAPAIGHHPAKCKKEGSPFIATGVRLSLDVTNLAVEAETFHVEDHLKTPEDVEAYIEELDIGEEPEEEEE